MHPVTTDHGGDGGGVAAHRAHSWEVCKYNITRPVQASLYPVSLLHKCALRYTIPTTSLNPTLLPLTQLYRLTFWSRNSTKVRVSVREWRNEMASDDQVKILPKKEGDDASSSNSSASDSSKTPLQICWLFNPYPIIRPQEMERDMQYVGTSHPFL